jgi:hypothetical protein
MALNNLAWFLTLRERGGAEALRLVNEAIGRAGPEAALLDTRAVVCLALRQSRQALRDLQDAIAQAPTGPRYFHLAQAHRLARDHRAARETFRKARAEGLRSQDLDPLERPAYEELRAELDPE